MKIKEQAIEELESMTPPELMIVYDLILSIKGKTSEQKVKKHNPAYLKVRNALKQCKGSISKEILEEREDRI